MDSYKLSWTRDFNSLDISYLVDELYTYLLPFDISNKISIDQPSQELILFDVSPT